LKKAVRVTPLSSKGKAAQGENPLDPFFHLSLYQEIFPYTYEIIGIRMAN